MTPSGHFVGPCVARCPCSSFSRELKKHRLAGSRSAVPTKRKMQAFLSGFIPLSIIVTMRRARSAHDCIIVFIYSWLLSSLICFAEIATSTPIGSARNDERFCFAFVADCIVLQAAARRDRHDFVAVATSLAMTKVPNADFRAWVTICCIRLTRYPFNSGYRDGI